MVSDQVFLFRGRAPIASMDAMEDMEVFTGSNPGLAPVCQVKYLILSSSILDMQRWQCPINNAR